MRYFLFLLVMIMGLAARGQSADPAAPEKVKQLMECWKEEKRKYLALGGGGKISSELDVAVEGVIKKLAGASFKAGGEIGGDAKAQILLEFQTTTHPEAQKAKFWVCYLGIFHPGASLAEVFQVIYPTAATPPTAAPPTAAPPRAAPARTSRPLTASALRGTRLKCSEFDKCPGKVESCILAGDDADKDANLLIENTSETPIAFGEWGNEQCGTSGVGWHVYYGSCGADAGSRLKRCKYVFIQP